MYRGMSSHHILRAESKVRWPSSFVILPRDQVDCGKASLGSFLQSSHRAAKPGPGFEGFLGLGSQDKWQLLAIAQVREAAGWTKLMKPLICKYFCVLNGRDSTSMSLKCSLDTCIDSGFLGNLGNVLQLLKEAKALWGNLVSNTSWISQVSATFSFFKCLAFVHLLWITLMFVGNISSPGIYNSV